MEEFRIIKFQNRHKKSGLSHHSTPPQHNTNHQQKRNINHPQAPCKPQEPQQAPKVNQM